MPLAHPPSYRENPVRWAFGVLGFGIKIPDIDRAPIRLNYLDIHHPFATSNELVQRISSHYMRQAIREVPSPTIHPFCLRPNKSVKH
jgi:hypothetical protein